MKIKQRKEETRNEFEKFKYFRIKIITSKIYASVSKRAIKALRLVEAATADLIQILESLILAQDERWRRA